MAHKTVAGRYRQLIGISVFWLGLSVVFDGVNTLVLPHRLLGLTPDTNRATLLGAITLVGLTIGMVVQPFAGVASDWLRPRWGRRGTLAIGVLLIFLALATLSILPLLPGLVMGYILLQISANLAQAAQQGFIPDLVPAPMRGTASGFKGFMDVGGALLGFVLLGRLLAQGQFEVALAAIAFIILVTFVLTLVLVREPAQPAGEVATRASLSGTLKLDLSQKPTFLWLVLARFFFLLGTYSVGRFLLLFVADRLGLDPSSAAEQTGNVLAGLTLITVLAAIPAGWAADKFGRKPMMLSGSMASAAGVLLLIVARDSWQILLFGGLMALGSAAFASANWASTADVVPADEAGRFLGLANFGTAGAAALAGVFGPLVDWANNASAGSGYVSLFVISSIAFAASALVLRGVSLSPRPLMAAPRGRDLTSAAN